jgi:CheY-like chemotaxis protein
MPHRLLLADDSVTIQKVIELTFADEDVTVVAVGDGDAAIAKLGTDTFDVVLADVGMPGRNGYEVAEFLRDRPGARVPVLLLTGAFDPVDEARVSAVGASGVLAKPFEPQVLVAKVRAMLAGIPITPPKPAEAVPEPPEVAQGSSKAPTVDDYFERLDRAFANLNVPLTTQAPPFRVHEPPAAPAAAVVQPSPPTPVDERPHGESRGLADRFERLLAVEQGQLPASVLEPPPSAGEADLVDRVARRVVEQLGDGAVRELAAEIVSRTAERLVREEIDRIKASVR